MICLCGQVKEGATRKVRGHRSVKERRGRIEVMGKIREG